MRSSAASSSASACSCGAAWRRKKRLESLIGWRFGTRIVMTAGFVSSARSGRTMAGARQLGAARYQDSGGWSVCRFFNDARLLRG
jgi:hypothetical protein